MEWEFNNIRVYVQDLNDTDIQEMAKLNPFGGGSIYHRFGYQDPTTKITGIIVGLDDRDALRVCKTDGNYYALNTPWGLWCSGYLKQMSSKLRNSYCQSMRGDLPDDSPVFDVELEIWQKIT
jgi:hypothetical protein